MKSVLAALSEKVYRKALSERPLVVAICGAADLGKSYISKKLVGELEAKGLQASHLSLDSYLMNRNERLKKGLSGYQIEAYDLRKSKKAVCDFKRNKTVYYSPYDHKLGRNCSIVNAIENGSVLIFDGLHSMYQEFSRYIDISIFIYTDDTQLKIIRTEADISKRGQTKKFSQINSSLELKNYKNFVEPYKFKCTYKLYLSKKWSYKFEN